MRKSIRPFVVETVKSRHDRSTLERNSFGALLAEAEPKFADHPAFKTASPEPAPAGALDRPAPKRVLDAVVPVEAPAPEPVERKRGRACSVLRPRCAARPPLRWRAPSSRLRRPGRASQRRHSFRQSRQRGPR
jgi:hypothetical protein